MALTVIPPLFTQQVTRGKTLNAGTFSAANNAVQFTISNLRDAPNGTDALSITAGGNLTATAFVLEGSLDAGVTWFVVTASAASAGANNSTAIISVTGTADTAAAFAATYNVTGLSGPTLFRFGVTGTITGSGNVYIVCP